MGTVFIDIKIYRLETLSMHVAFMHIRVCVSVCVSVVYAY